MGSKSGLYMLQKLLFFIHFNYYVLIHLFMDVVYMRHTLSAVCVLIEVKLHGPLFVGACVAVHCSE